MRVLAAITTPFGADGSPDLDVFEAHVRWLDEVGLDGLFVAGTTGEGVLLEYDEVEALAARAAAAAGSLRVIVQVGRPSTGATVALARRALAAGAHGVSAYVPWFYPVTPEQVRGHFLALLEAAGDAPAFLYNIPPRTVNDLSPELAGELARAGFAGMKDSTGDLERQLQYLAAVDSSSRSTPAPSRSSSSRWPPGRPARSTGSRTAGRSCSSRCAKRLRRATTSRSCTRRSRR